MIAATLRRLAAFWRADFCSPKDFVQRAVIIAVLFLAAHCAGWREYTSVLNGTMGSVEAGWATSAFLGAVYIFLYLAVVLLVPILLIAALLVWIWERVPKTKRGLKAKGPNKPHHQTSPRPTTP